MNMSRDLSELSWNCRGWTIITESIHAVYRLMFALLGAPSDHNSYDTTGPFCKACNDMMAFWMPSVCIEFPRMYWWPPRHTDSPWIYWHPKIGMGLTLACSNRATYTCTSHVRIPCVKLIPTSSGTGKYQITSRLHWELTQTRYT